MEMQISIQRNIVGHVKSCCNNFNDPNHTDLSPVLYSYVYCGHEPFLVSCLDGFLLLSVPIAF